MTLYYFYHIPGKKVGCTVNFEQRSYQYRRRGYDGAIELIEIKEFVSDDEAGNYEQELAANFGFSKSTHYRNNWSSRLSDEDRFAASQAGGLKAGQLGKSGFHQMTTEQRSEYGRRGALVTTARKNTAFHAGEAQRKAVKSPNHINNQKFTCPHCGKVGIGRSMYYWHFDRCRTRNNT